QLAAIGAAGAAGGVRFGIVHANSPERWPRRQAARCPEGYRTLLRRPYQARASPPANVAEDTRHGKRKVGKERRSQGIRLPQEDRIALLPPDDVIRSVTVVSIAIHLLRVSVSDVIPCL